MGLVIAGDGGFDEAGGLVNQINAADTADNGDKSENRANDLGDDAALFDEKENEIDEKQAEQGGGGYDELPILEQIEALEGEHKNGATGELDHQ